LNYGSTKESEIVSENPNRVDKLLEVKPYTEEGKEERSQIVTDETKNGNKQMSPEFSGERFGYLIITILSTIALSIPVLLLGIFKFLLQVWFLALVIFTAIPLVLSLIPSYSESALNHGKKLVGVLLMKAGLVLLIGVITGLVTLLYESVKVTNGVEGYVFVVFLICITMWGLFKYRSEIFEVASAGMVQGQQVVERATTNSFNQLGDAGEKGFKGARRMVGKAYKNHKRKKRQEEFLSGVGGTNRKTSPSSAVVAGGRSEHRKAVGENVSQKQGAGKQKQQQATGKEGKNTATFSTGEANRSASRNAGAAIVNLDDYKSGKGSVSGQTERNATQSEGRSSQRTAGKVNHQSSQHRKPSGRMEGQKEVAASRQKDKHLTKWEAQQQINAKKTKQSAEAVKRSESRKPKKKGSKQRK
jgi:hypothetical protein